MSARLSTKICRFPIFTLSGDSSAQSLALARERSRDKFKENKPENIDQWQTFLPWNTVWEPLGTLHPKHEQLDAQSSVMLPERLPYLPV